MNSSPRLDARSEKKGQCCFHAKFRQKAERWKSRNFKSENSTSVDVVRCWLLERVSTVIAALFVRERINESFNQSIFPDNSKFGKNLSWHKWGFIDDFSNYRPISLLPSSSQICERVFHACIYDFFDKYSLWHPKQYGFWSKCSTVEAVLRLIETIEGINRIHTIGVFDTVDHSLLLQKLEINVTRCKSLIYISSFFENRRQHIATGKKEPDFDLENAEFHRGQFLDPYYSSLSFLSSLIFFKNVQRCSFCRQYCY